MKKLVSIFLISTMLFSVIAFGNASVSADWEDVVHELYVAPTPIPTSVPVAVIHYEVSETVVAPGNTFTIKVTMTGPEGEAFFASTASWKMNFDREVFSFNGDVNRAWATTSNLNTSNGAKFSAMNVTVDADTVIADIEVTVDEDALPGKYEIVTDDAKANREYIVADPATIIIDVPLAYRNLYCETLNEEAIIIGSLPKTEIVEIPSEIKGYPVTGVTDNTCENLDSSLSTNINIIYNNAFYEGVLLKNNELNLFITVSNSGAARNLVCYLAEYDSKGKLIAFTENNTIPVATNESVTATLTKTFSNSDTASAKIFLWEDGNLKPIASSILLQTQPTDYYADVYTTAQNFDVSKTINGKINTISDVDYIKFVPVESGKYVVHTNSTVNVSGGLYDSQNNLIASGVALNGGYYCGAELISGNTYYLKTDSNTVGEYSINITKMSDDGFIEITNNSIKLTQDCNGSQVNVSLISSGMNTQSVNVLSNNNKITAEFGVNNLQSAYSIVVMENGVITSIYDIKTVSNSNIYDVTEKSYVSVPMIVSNVSDLSTVYFSVTFSENEFDVFDACEHTYTSSETGTGLISSAEVNIKAVEDNAVIFTSTKTLTNSWSDNINVVKLQAVDTGEYTVKTIAYSVK